MRSGLAAKTKWESRRVKVFILILFAAHFPPTFSLLHLVQYSRASFLNPFPSVPPYPCSAALPYICNGGLRREHSPRFVWQSGIHHRRLEKLSSLWQCLTVRRNCWVRESLCCRASKAQTRTHLFQWPECQQCFPPHRRGQSQ